MVLVWYPHHFLLSLATNEQKRVGGFLAQDFGPSRIWSHVLLVEGEEIRTIVGRRNSCDVTN